MSMSVQKSQVHKMAKFQDGVKRLCLVDDLKMLKITMSNTSSRNKLNLEINDHYNIFTRESQEYKLKTRDEAYSVGKVIRSQLIDALTPEVLIYRYSRPTSLSPLKVEGNSAMENLVVAYGNLNIVMENPNHLNEPNEAIPEVNLVVPEPNQVADIHDPNEMVDIPDDIDLVDYDDEDPEEDPEEEPEPNNRHGNQFAQHPNPQQPGNMNGWLEEDDVNENVNKEDIKDEDVEIKVDEDAELIFPYEVEGDQTPPPRDESSDSEPPNTELESFDYVSSDSESSDFESKDEEIEVAPEVDVTPEATIGTSTQNPYAIRDFPKGLYEVGESSSARDSSYVSGLAPWALRRDLETSRARARLTEAELSTNQTEIDLLKSKNKIGEKERELLNHDLENVERALGNVLEMVSVLESGENATLKKRLADTKTKLAWACMERDIVERRIMPPKAMSEARMREVIREQVAASMAEFMANMNRGAGGDRAGGAGAGGARAGGARAGGAGAGGAGAGGAGVGGAGPAAPKITGCTYITFMKCNLQPFKGTEGRALTWWNGRTASMGIDAANSTLWTEVRKWMTEEFCPRSVLQRLEQELYNLKLKGTDIDGYTNRFHELALLCPRMVEPEQVKVEQYIRGLSKNIRGDVTSSRPVGIDEAVCMAYQLMGQIIQDKTDEVSKGEKRKGKGDRGGRSDNRHDYNRRQNQKRANAGAMTNAAPNDNEVCPKCKNKKHGGD
ncbi:putative reverse transcriptase domain-containing protein [Tanacetum coccineum]